MSRKPRTTLPTVEKLIEQRRLFQDWMQKLSEGVEGMPPHVVERVRNDYRERLTGVMAELGEHRDGLREALAEAQQRHDELDDQHQAKKDELAELRLRKHVGEMDEGRFKEQSAQLQGVIDQVKKDLGSALRDIERYEEILDVIAEGDKPAEPEPEPAPVAEERREPEPAAATAVPESPRPERKSSPDVKVGGGVPDELAFLRSVTQTIDAVKPGPTPAPAQQPRGGANRAQPAAASAASAAPAPAPAPAEPVRKKEAAAEPVPVAFEAAPGLIELSPSEHDAEPAAAANVAPEPARDETAGLKCGECGAVNRPTEWYCEKCGAELAAF